MIVPFADTSVTLYRLVPKSSRTAVGNAGRCPYTVCEGVGVGPIEGEAVAEAVPVALAGGCGLVCATGAVAHADRSTAINEISPRLMGVQREAQAGVAGGHILGRVSAAQPKPPKDINADLAERVRTAQQGGSSRYAEKLREQHKLPVRQRLDLLLDRGYRVEDGVLAHSDEPGYGADGVVTVVGEIDGRTVCVMANDPTVKAGSWGARTVEKIIRLQETAERLRVPIYYLVDSAGARITDQVVMFPGRRHAGRIFWQEVQLSGVVPQICLLFGPSAAGGAYIPAFCDLTIMVEGNASMYLGSPRMAEMVIHEKVTLEEMGGARMHSTVSGSGDVLVSTEEEAIQLGRKYLGYFPQNWEQIPPVAEAHDAKAPVPLETLVPEDEGRAFNMQHLIDGVIDANSFFEIKKLYAKELITGLARLNGRPIGIIANQPMYKGGILFVESADKAARFIWLCDAFNIPLLFLADVPGFMIGTAVERQGIIRHGAKMISAVSEATVPKVSVIVRKAYGAGLYAMAGPAFDPDACLALPTAMIAVMGPSAAINAVFYNKIQELPESERPAYVQRLQNEYREDIDLYKLASELIIDAVIQPPDLRQELIARFALYASRKRARVARKHGVFPV
jgi:acetyl-CoA carboxylase carboxyltransferase component